MKKQFVRVLSVALILVLTVGFMPSAIAYNNPDFIDVPQSSWAYKDIMEMSDRGVIKGTGSGKFSPAEPLKVGEFLTLIGRAMYPTTETATFWESHYMAALEKGIITVTELLATPTVMERPITRYEMARIMVRVDELVVGTPRVTADTSKITDYAAIPADYRDYVEQAYTKGLLNGDANGNFKGSESLLREQAAAVVKRLLDSKANRDAEVADAEPFTIDYDTLTLTEAQNSRYLNPRGYMESVTWTSSNPNTVMVTEGGTVIAMDTGTATVTGTDRGGRTVTCVVTSDMAKREPTVELSGQKVKVTITGIVSCYDYSGNPDGDFIGCPSGVNVTLYGDPHGNGDVLGTAITQEYNPDDPESYSFIMVAYVDKAYTEHLKLMPAFQLYMKCTYIDSEGNRYSNIFADTGTLMVISIYGEYGKTQDLSAKFSNYVGNSEKQLLEF